MSVPAWVEEPTGYPDTSMHLVDPDGWWEVWVKWDGCMDWTRYFNVPRHMRTGQEDTDTELSENFHLCSVDEMIAMLQSVKERATERLGWVGDHR